MSSQCLHLQKSQQPWKGLLNTMVKEYKQWLQGNLTTIIDVDNCQHPCFLEVADLDRAVDNEQNIDNLYLLLPTCAKGSST